MTSSGASNANTQRSNNLLNLRPEDKDYNLKQIFFNDYINTTAINQILLGDTAYTLNDAVDEIRENDYCGNVLRDYLTDINKHMTLIAYTLIRNGIYSAYQHIESEVVA